MDELKGFDPKSQGWALAKLAIDLHLKGLPVELWSDFMANTVDALAEGMPENEREPYVATLLRAYDEGVDMRAAVLAMPTAGSA